MPASGVEKIPSREIPNNIFESHLEVFEYHENNETLKRNREELKHNFLCFNFKS